MYLLYYRKDILDSQNIPVPATWDDLVLAAQRLNGSDFNNDTRSDYALCFQIAGQYCSLDASVLIGLALAPQTQVKVGVVRRMPMIRALHFKTCSTLAS